MKKECRGLEPDPPPKIYKVPEPLTLADFAFMKKEGCVVRERYMGGLSGTPTPAKAAEILATRKIKPKPLKETREKENIPPIEFEDLGNV